MPLWVIAIILIVISIAITVVVASMQKKAEQTGPTAFKDFKFPIPDEGTPQAVVFGDVWTSDWQVLWVGNYRTEAIHNSGNGSKKG